MKPLPFFQSTFVFFLFWFSSTMLFNWIGAMFNDFTQQLLAQIGTWFIPAIVFVYFFYPNKGRDLKINKAGRFSEYLLFIALFVMLIPLTSYLQILNSALSLPESMGAFEQLLRQMEQAALIQTTRLLSGTSFLDLCSALLIAAVIPAICEEFFFRGVILNNLLKRTAKIHLSVWLSALLFSFVHFQFFGFLPRLMLGAALGYAFALSESLWVPIILHFLNNTLAVVTFYLYQIGKISENPLDINVQPLGISTVWMAVASFGVSISILRVILYRRNKQVNK